MQIIDRSMRLLFAAVLAATTLTACSTWLVSSPALAGTCGSVGLHLLSVESYEVLDSGSLEEDALSAGIAIGSGVGWFQSGSATVGILNEDGDQISVLSFLEDGR